MGIREVWARKYLKSIGQFRSIKVIFHCETSCLLWSSNTLRAWPFRGSNYNFHRHFCCFGSNGFCGNNQLLKFLQWDHVLRSGRHDELLKFLQRVHVLRSGRNHSTPQIYPNPLYIFISDSRTDILSSKNHRLSGMYLFIRLNNQM